MVDLRWFKRGGMSCWGIGLGIGMDAIFELSISAMWVNGSCWGPFLGFGFFVSLGHATAVFPPAMVEIVNLKGRSSNFPPSTAIVRKNRIIS